MTVSDEAAAAFVYERLGGDAGSVRPAGAGHWSVCHRFDRLGQPWVVRFGQQVIDFERDRFAQRWATAALPVPEVVEVGSAFDGHYVVSSFAPGSPLELVGAEQWTSLVPAVVDAFEAMRTTPVETDGFGPWSADGEAPFETWKDYLVAVGVDRPSMRTHGWSVRLRGHAAGEAAMRDGLALLAEMDLGGVSASVVHADLMNRNVHVESDRVSGVFDWGCSVIGDHVYEIAGPEFYAPHFPHLDIAALSGSLHDRWVDAGADLSGLADRRTAALLHVGLVHVAYNAFLEDWDALTATVSRTRELVPELG